MTTATAVKARPPTTVPVLDLDARLAATEAAMTVRLETALLRLSVDSAHVEQPALQVDAISAPVTPEPDTTPVAALLRRAQQRVLRPGGWVRDTGTDDRGGVCLEYALISEARTGRDEQEARILLRQTIGSGDPITQINRHLTGATQAGQLLGQAAELANLRNL